MRLLDARLLQENKVLSKNISVSRINARDVEPTLHYVSQISGIPFQDLHPVGSTGKAATSGDIDVAVNQNKHTPFKVHDRMIRALDTGDGITYGVYNKGTRVGSYAVPIIDEYRTIGDRQERVQVDLMFVDNIDWAKFSYFSAGESSAYKGAVRTVLLSAVAAALDEDGDTFFYDGDELVVRVGRGLDLSTGMKRLFQMRPHKKYGEGYVKGLQKVTPEDIKKVYPDLEFDGTDLIVDDPTEVVKILFGPATRPSNVDTAEEVLELIRRFPKKKQDKILNIAKIRAKQLAAKGIKLPDELR
jgi:hypothetical protein